MDESVVALSSVTAVYEGERAATLYDVTLSVAAGELLAIVGPNGSGKTTLLEVVNGLLPIAAGSVRVFGEAVDVGSHRVRARIAYVPQDLFFPPETPFLVRDVVMAARFAQIGAMRLPSRSDRARVGNALAAVRISSLSGRPIGRLSGGQQRKALLARALAQGARLLLLDEPTANLDPEAKSEVARLVLEIQRELMATTLVVSHEGGPLIQGADRVVTLDAGRITDDRPSSSARRPLGAGERR